MQLPLKFWIPIWAFMAWLALSFRKLEPNEIAAVDFLGKEWKERGPGGLVFVPFGPAKLHRFPTGSNQAEWPTEPRYVDKADGDNPEAGKEAPMRIAFVDYAQARWFKDDIESLDFKNAMSWDEYKTGLSEEEIEAIENEPRHQSLNGEIAIVTQWRNKLSFLFQFMRVMSEQDQAAIDECNRRLNDIVVSEAQAICGRMTFLHAVKHIEAISKLLQKKTEEAVQEGRRVSSEGNSDEGEPWGIDIDKVYFKSFDPGKTVNVDLAKAAAAKSRRQATILDADAEAEAIRKRGQGEADAIEVKAKAMSTPEGARAAELDAARHVAAETELIIATGDQSGNTSILPQIAGMKHMLESKGNKPPADERKKATEKPDSVPDQSPIEQVEETMRENDGKDQK